jgi:hypothetical protein
MFDVPKAIASLVDWLLKFRAEERAETKAAASALRKAILETELLFGQKARGTEPTPEAKATVARLWMDASTEFRTVDRPVSDGCLKISLEVAGSLGFSEGERQTFDSSYREVINRGVGHSGET